MQQNTAVWLAAWYLLLCGLGGTAVCARDAGDNATASGRQGPWTVRFFSLQPRHSIGDAQFSLLRDSVFDFVIPGEEMRNASGSFDIDGIRFTARVEFSVLKERKYDYSITFNGIVIADTYAGYATLQERIKGGVLTQKVPFLFYAFSQTQATKPSLLPFLGK